MYWLSFLRHQLTSLIKKVQERFKRRPAFTLIEILLTIGIISIISTIVIATVGPRDSMLRAYDLERQFNARQLSNALFQYLIVEQRMHPELPEGSGNKEKVCAEGENCVGADLSDIAPNFLASIPKDKAEPCTAYSGYETYFEGGRPNTIAAHLGKMPGDVTGPCITIGITVTPTSGLVTTEAGGTAQFTVVLDSEPTADVTVTLSSSDATEGDVSPTSLTFTDANWDTAQTVTITGVDDPDDDGDIAYAAVTNAATSADTNYNGLDTDDVAVTNTDDDTGGPPAGITVNPTSGLVTTEQGGQAQFTVVLDAAPTANVVFDITSSDSSEGTVSPTTVTFTTGNWSTQQTITVTGVDDTETDGNISYAAITNSVTSADGDYHNMNPDDVSVSNTDDDGPPTCNGQLADIYVNKNTNKIVGGPDHGEDYEGELDGTLSDEVLVGSSGDDEIDGRGGDDIICGGSGNDEIQGGNGQEWIDGGDGNDEIRGEGHNDTLIGGDGNDEIYGGNGNDTITGGDGNDIIDGGGNSDTITGGDGDDDIEGGNGNDTIYGNDGNDTIEGEGNADTIYGGDGNDTITGGNGSDEIHGEAGNDTIEGDGNADVVCGGDDNDDIETDSGNDRIDGGAGSDDIDGGSNTDICVNGESLDDCEDTSTPVPECA